MSESPERLQKLKETLLQTEILAQFGGTLVSPKATEFVANLMREWFVIDNDGQFVQTDQTPLRTSDLQPMEVDQVGDYLKAKHPYLFRESGTPGVSNATTVAPLSNKAEMDLAARCAYILAHGQEAYEALPNNPVAAKPLAERPRSTWSVEEKADFVRRHGSEEYFKIPA